MPEDSTDSHANPDPGASVKRRVSHREALLRERRSQLRGLLFLAAIVFLFLLLRARPLHLFHTDWWRP